jgi:hypothetical protein
MKVGHYDKGESKPAKSALTKQAFEAQINAMKDPCCTVKGGWTMPMHINMKVLGGKAIGTDHNTLILTGKK